MDAIDACSIRKLSFPSLDLIHLYNFDIHNNQSVRDSLRDFFEKHQHIRQLNFTMSNNNRFKDYFLELPNVEQVFIKSYDNFNVDIISGFVDGHKKLAKFQYQAQHNQPNIAIYNERFGNQWNISYNRGEDPLLTFEKKN